MAKPGERVDRVPGTGGDANILDRGDWRDTFNVERKADWWLTLRRVWGDAVGMTLRSLVLVAGGCALLLFLAGCRTGTLARPVAEERTYEAEMETVFDETQALLEARDYRIRFSSAASGKIEALSLIRADAGFRQATQRRLRVIVREEGPGQSRVLITGMLLEESEIPVHGRGTYERPLVEPWYYEEIFEELGRRLANR